MTDSYLHGRNYYYTGKMKSTLHIQSLIILDRRNSFLRIQQQHMCLHYTFEIGYFLRNLYLQRSYVQPCPTIDITHDRTQMEI